MRLNIIDDRPVIIDIGSGPHPKADSTIRMDVHPWPDVTHVHDLHNFPYPFPDNYADKIYLGDVIEHIIFLAAPLVLKEINRILKPNGVLDITTPDFEWIMKTLVNGEWEKNAPDWLKKHEDPWDNAMGYFFGGWLHPEEYKIPGMGHINGFNERTLKRDLEAAGFINVVRVPDERNPEPGRDAVLKMFAYKKND